MWSLALMTLGVKRIIHSVFQTQKSRSERLVIHRLAAATMAETPRSFHFRVRKTPRITLPLHKNNNGAIHATAKIRFTLKTYYNAMTNYYYASHLD